MYYEDTAAVIFVIDSADESQYLTSKAEFFNLLVANDLQHTPILIFANKQDMPSARTEQEIIE